jgi:maltooligosyltrehalose trehalohydrolase
VRKGRRTEYDWAYDKFGDEVPDPLDVETFKSAVIDWDSRNEGPGKERLALVRELLAVRHNEIRPRLPGTAFGKAGVGADGVLAAHWTMGDGARLDLIANLSANEIAAPPAAAARAPIWGDVPTDRLSPWSVLWSLGEG